MRAIEALRTMPSMVPAVSIAAACRVRRSTGVVGPDRPRLRRPSRPKPPRALSQPERQQVLDGLHSEPFADKALAQVHVALLDQGQYLCLIRTMYRILDQQQEVRERRDQLRHPPYPKPQLVATAPHQVWSWDITKLLGAAKWTYFYLYVILDILSRYVVGWMLAHRESEHLAQRLIRETVVKQGVARDQLTIHSDRGPLMRSQTVAQLLATLGITKCHSRPHVSNDHPFSERQFKTLKCRPEFPDRFASFEHALEFCGTFFHWHNHQHHHRGLGLLTPATVHHGRAAAVLAARQADLNAADAAHSERFVCQPPRPLPLPQQVWINPRPIGRSPVCYNYRATLISYRSCPKSIATFRTAGVRSWHPPAPPGASRDVKTG